MNLDETQKQKVARWIEEGLKLSEIQDKIAQEFGTRVTYLDVRLLVDDLKLKLKEPPKPAPAPEEAGKPAPAEEEAVPTGKVSVAVDSVTRPGSLVSGSVTFSDGKKAEWYLDQMGRLGISPQEQGYRPSQADVQAFQMELQRQLQGIGGM